jgi:hypothetical protein
VFGGSGSRAFAEAEVEQADVIVGVGRVELVLDVGSFGPGPELFFFVGCGVGLRKGEVFAFEAKAFGEEVESAEAGDDGAEFAEAGPVGVGL